MKPHTGSCHCGRIRFSFSSPEIASGMRCNCSICRRKGGILSNFVLAPDEIQIHADGDSLSTYRFGTGVATHCFCRYCGISPFVQTRLNPGHYRVNLGCLDGLNPYALEAQVYDGLALD